MTSTATFAAPAVLALCALTALITALFAMFVTRLTYGPRIQQLNADLARLTHLVGRNAAQLNGARHDLKLQRMAAADAMEQQQAQHDEQIATLQASSTQLSQYERELIQQMATKLNLAAASLHATQQYKDSREAKNLASRGLLLAARLQQQPHPELAQVTTSEEPDPLTDAEDTARPLLGDAA